MISSAHTAAGDGERQTRSLDSAEDGDGAGLADQLSTSDGLWDWNLVTNEVYFSPRWKTMLGFTDEEIPNSFAVFRQLVHRDRFGQQPWKSG